MRVKTCVVLLGVLVAASSAFGTSLLPLTPAASEAGFGTQYASLSSPFSGGGFNGTLYSRVYVDAVPASQVTFVYELQVGLGLTGVEDLSIAAVTGQNDLRIGEILAGVHGYVTSATDKIPDTADAFDNAHPTADVLAYGWIGSNRLFSNERSTVYVTTTGAVDVGQVNAAIQDGSVASATVLAPVDDPDSPDLEVPEPASLVLFGLGACALIRRRR